MPEQPRIAGLVAGLSVASDLSRGLEDGQGMRTCLLAMRLADHLDLDAADRATLYWLALLRFVGCTATASDMAAALGDELAVSAAFAAVDAHDLRAVLRAAVAAVGSRPDRVLALLAKAPRTVRDHENASCEVAQVIAARLGLPPAVAAALGQVFERWDGRGHPGHAGGADLAPAVRVWQIAHLADLTGGSPDAIAAMLRERAGSTLDPDFAGRCAANAPAVFTDPPDADVERVLAAEPAPHQVVADERLDDVLAVFGLVADLKAPCFLGHSERVSDLAARAAAHLGHGEPEIRRVRQAGLVQDVGRVAVSARIWTKSAPLTAAEREHIRLHPYHSQRVLARVPELAAVADLAAAHHERLDGSGYHRGLTGTALAPLAAVLAAADAYVTAGAERPHRPPLGPAERRRALAGEADSGRLPLFAVDAVLAAAGEVAPVRPVAQAPAGLTPRERQVLAAVATGATNRSAGRALGISAKTVNAHLEHAYAKLGVSTRAAAIVLGLQNGWLELPP